VKKRVDELRVGDVIRCGVGIPHGWNEHVSFYGVPAGAERLDEKFITIYAIKVLADDYYLFQTLEFGKILLIRAEFVDDEYDPKKHYRYDVIV
jgi:hypothetical protein